VAPTQAAMELAALRAARVVGVRRVVKLSAIGADPLSDGHFSQAHGIVEAALQTSGLGWTIVRGAFFYSNLLFAADTIKDHDQYIGHWGDAPGEWPPLGQAASSSAVAGLGLAFTHADA